MASGRGRHGRGLAAILTGFAAALAATAGCSSGPAIAPQAGYERAARLVLPSVVQIRAGKSTGSGVVFDSKGDIVTNAHVVAGAKNYQVLDSAAAQPLAARMVGSFAPDDLAVIKVTSDAKVLPPVRWAESDKAQVGQLVLAMGSPFGLADSVTQGIISATGRTVADPATGHEPPAVITDALQTSAAINPGNSGGALVLLSGAVLGIPTQIVKNPEPGGTAGGVGFAIPSDTVRTIATQLIRSGHVTTSGRASLQITGSTHTNKEGNPDGVAVDATQPGGAAAVAGIKIGDVINEFGGQPTRTLAQLEDALIDYVPGARVSAKVLRNGVRQTFSIKLGSLSSLP